MTIEDDFRASEKIYQMTSMLIAEGEKPFAVAAMYTMVALQIYKTMMSEQEYNRMVDIISESRDRVKPLGNINTGMLN